ncbi:hypothetical protein EUGRSUZ_G03069 [Eucalyptus grandis]|uniref:Uncharacterized protein n=2 Tax=Eucalyptus grandis TaxID=71139 RepID=A0ACC3K9J5_EUCGR|nr:hypothetical protein EUGRSUZ_G03069 [Eucalyptus grandis]
MAGGNFLHRVISYVANEIVVNGLANSPAFQRFAVRTSKRLEELGELICFIDIKSRATLWAEYLKIAVVFLLF